MGHAMLQYMSQIMNPVRSFAQLETPCINNMQSYKINQSRRERTLTVRGRCLHENRITVDIKKDFNQVGRGKASVSASYF